LRLNHAKVHSEFNVFASIIKSKTLVYVEMTYLMCEAGEYLNLCGNARYATSLSTLDFSHVKFFDHFEKNIYKPNLKPSHNQAAIALSEAIVSCSNIQELKLVDCGIKQAEIKLMVSAVLKCSSLISVNLSDNDMLKSISKDLFAKIKTSDQLLELIISTQSGECTNITTLSTFQFE